ncbi:hypothetical protein Q8A67_015978 [Cirrhinus molitorella]|uniref:Uncharacterized protein n=1 Tax=Cirrhinus molitorella TaxID=172907 RepID=A0AA88TKL1_9TELE|nr:hypothetical protein Q8A67_015978 [Cirrhinus molitorella]
MPLFTKLSKTRGLIVLFMMLNMCRFASSVPLQKRSSNCLCFLSCDEAEAKLKEHERVEIYVQHQSDQLYNKVHEVSSLFKGGQCSVVVPHCLQQYNQVELRIFPNHKKFHQPVYTKMDLKPECDTEKPPEEKDKLTDKEEKTHSITDQPEDVESTELGLVKKLSVGLPVGLLVAFLADTISVKIGEELKLEIMLPDADKVKHQSRERTEWMEVWRRSRRVQSERMRISDGNLIISNFTARDTGTYRVLDPDGKPLITVKVRVSKEKLDNTDTEKTDDATYLSYSIGLTVVLVLLALILTAAALHTCQRRGYSRGVTRRGKERLNTGEPEALRAHNDDCQGPGRT